MSEDFPGADDVRQLQTDSDSPPSVQIVEEVADLRGCDPSSLTPAYTVIDDMLQELFSEPPSKEADVNVSFTYEAYRITVTQDGAAVFGSIQ